MLGLVVSCSPSPSIGRGGRGVRGSHADRTHLHPVLFPPSPACGGRGPGGWGARLSGARSRSLPTGPAGTWRRARGRTGRSRAARLAPDHAPVVGAHGPREAGVAQRAQHRAHVHVAEARRVRASWNSPLARDEHVAAVREVDAPPRAERRAIAGRSLAGSAPSEPVQKVTPFAGLSTRSHEPLERRAARDDPRQPEDRPRRIVRVDGHAHPHRLRDRHHALQEVREVLPQPLGVHLAVRGEQRRQLVAAYAVAQPGRSPVPRDRSIRASAAVVVRERRRAVGERAARGRCASSRRWA